MVKFSIVLVAVVSVLALASLSGCASSNESATSSEGAVVEGLRDDLAGTLAADCAYFEKVGSDSMELLDEAAASDDADDVVRAVNLVFAQIWPNVSDPDLKSVTRILATTDDLQLMESTFTSYLAIC